MYKRQWKDRLDKVRDARNMVAQRGTELVGPLVGNPATRLSAQVVSALGSKDAEEMFSKQRELEFLVNTTVLELADKMKGNLSEKELALLKSSAPKLTDPPQVWIQFLNKLEQTLKTSINILQDTLQKTGAAAASQQIQPGALATPAARETAPAPSQPSLQQRGQDVQELTVIKDHSGNLTFPPGTQIRPHVRYRIILDGRLYGEALGREILSRLRQ